MWFAELLRVWVRREGILPTVCSIQTPLHEKKHLPPERVQRAEDGISAAIEGWSEPFTTQLESSFSSSHPEQSCGPESCLPNTLCLLSLHTFAPAIPSIWSAICLPAISQILIHPFKAQTRSCLSISGAILAVRKCREQPGTVHEFLGIGVQKESLRGRSHFPPRKKSKI